MPTPPSSRKAAPIRIAVIGAGVIGLSVALELRSRGAEVAVYDRGLELGAGVTIRSAGMLGVAFDWAAEGEDRSLAALARHAGMLWPDYAARVERLGGGSVELSSAGSLVVARTDAEAEWLEELTAACQARGLPGHTLTRSALEAREPAITGKVRSALLLPEDQQVDPALLLQRLGAALARAGVGLRFGRHVERIVGGQVVPDAGRRQVRSRCAGDGRAGGAGVCRAARGAAGAGPACADTGEGADAGAGAVGPDAAPCDPYAGHLYRAEITVGAGWRFGGARARGYRC